MRACPGMLIRYFRRKKGSTAKHLLDPCLYQPALHCQRVAQLVTTAINLMGRKEAAAVASDVVDATAKVQKKVDNGPVGTSDASYRTAGSSRTLKSQ